MAKIKLERDETWNGKQYHGLNTHENKLPFSPTEHFEDDKTIIHQFLDGEGRIWNGETWNPSVESIRNPMKVELRMDDKLEEQKDNNKEVGLYHKNETSLKIHKCNTYTHTTNKPSSLNEHAKNFKCTMCSYSSSSRSYLQIHMDGMHTNHKDKICNFCNYTTDHTSDLKNHINSVHLNIKKRKSGFSEFSAAKKVRLGAQVVSIHLNLKNFKCSLCNFTTPYSNNLKKHLDCVHVKCNLCDYSAVNKSELQYHVSNIHLNVKNFKCGWCDFNATNKNSLEVHINSVHLNFKQHKYTRCT